MVFCNYAIYNITVRILGVEGIYSKSLLINTNYKIEKNASYYTISSEKKNSDLKIIEIYDDTTLITTSSSIPLTFSEKRLYGCHLLIINITTFSGDVFLLSNDEYAYCIEPPFFPYEKINLLIVLSCIISLSILIGIIYYIKTKKKNYLY
jgi:hypothetical protein